MKQEVKQVIITPEYAAELLKMNINNRSVRTRKVAELADAMRKGEWELSNDAIVISEGNILLNGQHRLMAVVKSGVPCPFILFTGARDSAFDVMDTPVVRKLSDAIERKGGKSASNIATALTRYIRLHEDKVNEWETIKRYDFHTCATRRTTVKVYEANEKVIEKWIKKVENVNKKGCHLIPIGSLAALAIFLELDMLHGEERIESYIKALLIDGATQHKTILAVRKKFMLHKMKKERIDRTDQLRYLIRGWNDFLFDREVNYIKTDEDSFYFIRPF